MLDLFAELLDITETLEKQSVPYALVGGLAYSVYIAGLEKLLERRGTP